CERAGVEPRARFRELLREFASGYLHGPFNVEARLLAGFDEDELESLRDVEAEQAGGGAGLPRSPAPAPAAARRRRQPAAPGRVRTSRRARCAGSRACPLAARAPPRGGCGRGPAGPRRSGRGWPRPWPG